MEADPELMQRGAEYLERVQASPPLAGIHTLTPPEAREEAKWREEGYDVVGFRGRKRDDGY